MMPFQNLGSVPQSLVLQRLRRLLLADPGIIGTLRVPQAPPTDDVRASPPYMPDQEDVRASQPYMPDEERVGQPYTPDEGGAPSPGGVGAGGAVGGAWPLKRRWNPYRRGRAGLSDVVSERW
jgi:hypothetical protein